MKQHQIGLGLRPCHYDYIEKNRPDISFFEVLSDNFLYLSGTRQFHLEKICSWYPVTLHGVGMSLGSTDPLNFSYLKKLKSLIEFTKPLLVSDHACWTSFNNQYFHELLPLPYTEETVLHLASRIRDVQHFLGRQIAIENVSSYLQFSSSYLTEWDFLRAVADEADCLILLDINNIYVSAKNNHFDPELYLKHIPRKRVAQFHLAGFSEKENFLLDTHGDAIHPDVWNLLSNAFSYFGNVATVIERDANIPEFESLQKELQQIKNRMEKNVVSA